MLLFQHTIEKCMSNKSMSPHCLIKMSIKDVTIFGKKYAIFMKIVF